MAQSSHPPGGPQRIPHGTSFFHMDSSLFLELEIPYKWWEDEATTIFWANSVHDMRRLLRFQLYGDDNLPKSTLLGRNAGTVKGFFRQLLHLNEQAYVDNLSHQETVEQIVLLCQQNRPSQRRWSWSPSALQADDSHAIALAIGEESYRQFQRVSFEDWVRFALGYPTQSVEWLITQHRELYRLLSTHLYSSPHDMDKFIGVEKFLRSLCPFAHLTMLHCLEGRNIVVPNSPSSGEWLAKFLVKPIRRLFRSQPSSLPLLLKKLSTLAIRFEQTYHQGSNIDWNAALGMGSRYLDELCTDKSAFVMARTLTLSDERDFSSLSVQSFMMSDGVLNSLVANWGELCTFTSQCYTANPDMSDYIQDCAKNLYSLKNYHSTSAIVHGLQMANPTAFNSFTTQQGVQASESQQNRHPYLILLDSSDNYGGYRRIIQEKHGLPFLLPHITEYRQRGRDALAGMFPLPLQ